MLIKYGAEDHLKGLMEKGGMYFNPCEYFRKLEESQKKKGIGDGNDGGVSAAFYDIQMISPDGERHEIKDGNMSLIVEPAKRTPVFCLRRTNTKYISSEYREKLRSQFPEHTHALIIRDEKGFLENVRYNMRNQAFAHTVFYENQLSTEFYQFMQHGFSNILFYERNCSKRKYYMEIKLRYTGDDKLRDLFINDSNFYRTMFRKDCFFEDQREFRIVLPYKQIDEGRTYQINPFFAELVKLDELIKDVTEEA